MATLAASRPRPERIPHRRAVRVVVLAALVVVAGAVYAWIRIPVGLEYHAQFARFCAGIPMQPQDLHCRLTEASTVLAVLLGSLLGGLGLALPGAILATGRRLSAVVPVLVAGGGSAIVAMLSGTGRIPGPFGVPETFFSGGSRSLWTQRPALAVLIDVLLVSVPALAIAFVLRPPRRPKDDALPRHAAWIATATIATAIVAVHFALSRIAPDFFVETLTEVWTIVAIALFGAMLGTDRRWWPWSIAPVAVLLSFGPSTAVVSIPGDVTALTWFGGVIPLAVYGVLASMWRPLADKLAGWHNRGTDSAVGTATEPHRALTGFRPVVVLNALGVALLSICAIAKAADPLPIQLATPLATYLGARYLAQDVRAQMNLDLATDAIHDYRAEHGSYAGFDAAAGEFGVPQLDWSDRQVGEELTVTVATASHDLAQLVVRSGSGGVYCLQAFGPAAVLTLGSAHRSVPQARASCEVSAWSPDVIPAFDVAVFCEGVDPGGLPICRSVQDLFRTTIAAPTAN